jgi:hypothetical protein
MTDPPVACLLSEPELRERRRTVLADFKAARLEVRDLADGYAFRFAPSSQQLTALAELIDLERRCCPFLRFRLIAEPAGGPLWLEMTGPAGTREMLAHELGLIDDPPPAELFPEQLRARSYLERKGTLATTEALRGQVAEAFRLIEDLFASVVPADRSKSPAPGKWSPHEILDHLVISHRPAIPQLASLLNGTSPGGVAIPAGLSTPVEQRRSWDELLAELRAVHREIEALLADASDALSLEPKAVVEMVVKVAADEQEPRPVHWFEKLDWKAFVQAVRAHTLEHRSQLERTL